MLFLNYLSIYGIKLGQLDEFEKAGCVKVNPDSPQKQVRFLTLTGYLILIIFVLCYGFTR